MNWSFVNNFCRKFGYEIRRWPPSYPIDFGKKETEIIESCKKFTMTSIERMYDLIQCVRWVIENNIPGGIVECGVWKGGSMMIVAKTLLDLNCRDIDLFLFDTFSGMPKPAEEDYSMARSRSASELFEQSKIDEDSSTWNNISLDNVRKALYSTGYPKEKCHFVKGKVEDTIQDQAPNSISLLRLDTDFYQSTKHELVHLFPRLSRGGVLIIDDYGNYTGSKKAVDEYFSKNKIPIRLNRIDYSCRTGIKI